VPRFPVASRACFCKMRAMRLLLIAIVTLIPGEGESFAQIGHRRVVPRPGGSATEQPSVME
jgi:hypothetical protein